MQTVISAFDDRELAQRAVDRLVERGFDRDDIHLQLGHERSAVGDAGTEEHHGFLDSIARFFADLFGTHEPAGDSGRYAEAVRRGSTVLVLDVRDEDEAARARSALEELGGHVDLDERASQWQREGWSGFESGVAGARADERTTERPSTGSDERIGEGVAQSSRRAADESVLPVLEEQLQVGKREVQRGGVRVVQRMTETPVKELVRLREERAVVERHPVDRPATQADFQAFQEGSIEMRETIEEPVVSKSARVVEEVVVGKRVEEHTQTVEDVVRRAAVEVEPLGQGASDRMLERTGGDITAAQEDAAARDRRDAGADTPRSDTAADPEIVERTR